MAISIRLDPKTEERLTALAERTGRSKTFYVRQALMTHLDELEEIFWADEVVHKWIQQGRQSRPADEYWSQHEE